MLSGSGASHAAPVWVCVLHVVCLLVCCKLCSVTGCMFEAARYASHVDCRTPMLCAAASYTLYAVRCDVARIAQLALGECYEHGVGLAHDAHAAAEWYTKAAASGLPAGVRRVLQRVASCLLHGAFIIGKEHLSELHWASVPSPLHAFRCREDSLSTHDHPERPLGWSPLDLLPCGSALRSCEAQAADRMAPAANGCTSTRRNGQRSRRRRNSDEQCGPHCARRRCEGRHVHGGAHPAGLVVRRYVTPPGPSRVCWCRPSFVQLQSGPHELHKAPRPTGPDLPLLIRDGGPRPLRVGVKLTGLSSR